MTFGHKFTNKREREGGGEIHVMIILISAHCRRESDSKGREEERRGFSSSALTSSTIHHHLLLFLLLLPLPPAVVQLTLYLSISMSHNSSTTSPWITISFPPWTLSLTEAPQANAFPNALATSLILRSVCRRKEEEERRRRGHGWSLPYLW